jgi:hypothetical protein
MPDLRVKALSAKPATRRPRRFIRHESSADPSWYGTAVGAARSSSCSRKRDHVTCPAEIDHNHIHQQPVNIGLTCAQNATGKEP